jgi:hypothetical protein
MAGGVDVLLREASNAVRRIRSQYERDLAAKEVSDKLLYAVRQVVGDCQSALDWTATAIKEKFYPERDWMPYYPLGKNPGAFEKALDSQLAGLRTDHPSVAAAFERHQPYRPGKSELGYLKPLRKINTHRDFTPQTRTESRTLSFTHGGAAITLGEGAAIQISGNADVLIGGRSIRHIPPVTTTYVDWRFNEPPVSVLPTLEALVRHVRAAVKDIRSEAQL